MVLYTVNPRLSAGLMNFRIIEAFYNRFYIGGIQLTVRINEGVRITGVRINEG